jgi:hypothetical protein
MKEISPSVQMPSCLVPVAWRLLKECFRQGIADEFALTESRISDSEVIYKAADDLE